MPKRLGVNDLIPACEKAISSCEAKIKRVGDFVMKETLPLAHSLLEELIRMHEEFHQKVDAFGPRKLYKWEDGHEYTVQQRCYGDGVDPANCSRLFVKVCGF